MRCAERAPTTATSCGIRFAARRACRGTACRAPTGGHLASFLSRNCGHVRACSCWWSLAKPPRAPRVSARSSMSLAPFAPWREQNDLPVAVRRQHTVNVGPPEVNQRGKSGTQERDGSGAVFLVPWVPASHKVPAALSGTRQPGTGTACRAPTVGTAAEGETSGWEAKTPRIPAQASCRVGSGGASLARRARLASHSSTRLAMSWAHASIPRQWVLRTRS